MVLSAAMTDDERGMADCVRKAMREQDASLRMVSAREFRDALFPWFDVQASSEELAAGLSLRPVHDAIARLNVRYAILVNEERGKPQGFHGVVTVSVSVQVWDVERAQDRGALWASASGGSAFIGTVYPLMIGVVEISSPEDAVCRGLSEWLGRALMSGEH